MLWKEFLKNLNCCTNKSFAIFVWIRRVEFSHENTLGNVFTMFIVWINSDWVINLKISSFFGAIQNLTHLYLIEPSCSLNFTSLQICANFCTRYWQLKFEKEHHMRNTRWSRSLWISIIKSCCGLKSEERRQFNLITLVFEDFFRRLRCRC